MVEHGGDGEEEEPLLENAKELAVASRVTLSEIVGDALREYLAKRPAAGKSEFRLHTVKGRIVRKDLDMSRTSALVTLEMPGCVLIRAGARHWGIFRGLCEGRKLKGKLVADAAHAALAMESGCEWVSADSDFARFAPPLRWRLL